MITKDDEKRVSELINERAYLIDQMKLKAAEMQMLSDQADELKKEIEVITSKYNPL
jgi:phage shock protein A